MTIKNPVTIKITPKILRQFQEAEISTDWNIQQFDNGEGWLSELNSYTFKREIIIEGPSAFYGGLYSPNVWTSEGGLCSMGAASYSHSPLPEAMTVGRYCSIGKGLRFLDFSHPTEWISSSVAFFKPVGTSSISTLANLCDRLIESQDSNFCREEFDPKIGKEYPNLGHDIWIGENVSLAMGISIGTGAVVASSSVVTKDVPPYAVVAGVPATVKKYRFEQDLITDLLECEWWMYCFSDFAGMDIDKPALFVVQLQEKVDICQIKRWKPKFLDLPKDIMFD